jgi:hypothetical protein
MPPLVRDPLRLRRTACDVGRESWQMRVLHCISSGFRVCWIVKGARSKQRQWQGRMLLRCPLKAVILPRITVPMRVAGPSRMASDRQSLSSHNAVSSYRFLPKTARTMTENFFSKSEKNAASVK